ncbi:MAG: HAD-IIIC family phosphatase, partial [Actinobacteria bacterium]|nr:HAD-IIIC family phosphatase [Actinomycetota bacterium]
MEQIKLVIWDLDDTLWAGTISEGPIEHIPRNHDIVVALAQRGIISSICSMNDKSVALEELQKSSMSDYFVLPSIDWNPKGPRIRHLIEDLNLRPINVLFIDDLAKNLEEARFVCPDLNVALPEILDTLLDNPAVAGKPDLALKRLKQYKVLERKISEQSAFRGDTNDFLRQSDIKVAVLPPTEKDMERIEELINRSNQLNFTKLRVDQSTLAHYVNSTDSTTGAVWVSDK